MLVKIIKTYASGMRSGTRKGKDGKTDDKTFIKKSEQELCEKAVKGRKGLTR